MEIAKKYIQSGADKLVINSNLFNESLLNKISKNFGEQCIIGSLDYFNENKNFSFYVKNGKSRINLKINKIFKLLSKLPIGEVLLNSIDMDGTGNGFDFQF